MVCCNCFSDKLTNKQIEKLCPYPERLNWAACWWCATRYKLIKRKGRFKLKSII